MRITLNIPDDLIQEEIATRIRSLNTDIGGLKVLEVQLLEIQSMHNYLVMNCRVVVDYNKSFLSISGLNLHTTVRLEPSMHKDDFALKLVGIDEIVVEGLKSNWKNRSLERILGVIQPLAIKRVNQELEKLSDFDWKQFLDRAVITPVENQIKANTGLGVKTMAINLINTSKEVNSDVWLDLNTDMLWSTEESNKQIEAHFFLEQPDGPEWDLVLNEKAILQLILRFLDSSENLRGLSITQLQLHHQQLMLDVRLHQPVNLRLRYTGSIVFNDRKLQVRQPKIETIEGKKGWREKLMLPGIKWILKGQWKQERSWSFKQIEEILNDQIVNALEKGEKTIELKPAVVIKDIYWYENQICCKLSGRLGLEKLD